LISKDLRAWYLVHVEGYNTQFNNYMSIKEGKETLVCSTGQSLVSFGKDELEIFMSKKRPVMVSYKPRFLNLMDLVHKLKIIIRKVVY
jgi:hypothetical protein